MHIFVNMCSRGEWDSLFNAWPTVIQIVCIYMYIYVYLDIYICICLYQSIYVYLLCEYTFKGGMGLDIECMAHRDPAYTCIYVYTCTCRQRYIYICAYIDTYMYTHWWVYTLRGNETRYSTHGPPWSSTYMYICTYMYMYTEKCIYMHI